MRNDTRQNAKESFFYFRQSSKLFRDYQFNIVKACLQTNTLVCLPTGLGKTLIASIIMFNFRHWFKGKIFFFAPTKPLVNQQKQSFERLFSSLSEEVIEMNGLISRKRREEMYRDYTFFFLTPQTFDNDLTHHLLNCSQISLMIFDEAHKAQKNYSYANIVKKVLEQSPNCFFRTIGLSASPGGSAEAIQNVINALMIRRLEFRTEKDKDIKRYIFNKRIVIEEIEMNADMNKIQSLLEGLIKQRLDVLLKFHITDKAISPKYLTVTQLLKMQNNFKQQREEIEQDIGRLMVSEIYQTFSLLFQVLHCKKKLISEGLESFKEGINKIDRPIQQEGSSALYSTKKKWVTPGKSFKKKFITPYSTARKNLVESNEFQEIKKELQRYETTLTNSNNKQYHPKLVKLKEILLNQIDSLCNGSKVIVFADYKDTIAEIKSYLAGLKELSQIGVEAFSGQGKNFTQKDQLEVMRRFREGELSVLIATCVAEEGLDIGEVDLIICYDFNTTSPIRMIQRFGRTGRKRNGAVIVLATKGEEKSKYYRALRRIKSLHSNLKGLTEEGILDKKISVWGSNDNVLTVPQSYFSLVEEIKLDEDKEDDNEDCLSESDEGEDDEEDCEDSHEGEFKSKTVKSKHEKTNACHSKTSKKVAFSQPDPINVHDSRPNNQYDITKYFMSTPKVAQASQVNNDSLPKVLLSFKIKKEKTEDGRYITSSSHRPSSEVNPEVSKDKPSIEDSSMKIADSPIHINQLELDKIIEEIETDNKANASLPHPLKEHSNNNTVKSNKSNQRCSDFFTEDVINDLLKEFFPEEAQPMLESSKNKENLPINTHSTWLRESFPKRRYEDFLKTKID